MRKCFRDISFVNDPVDKTYKMLIFTLTIILMLAFSPPYSWAEGILVDVIAGKGEIVDLTHVLSEDIPIFPGSKPFKLTHISSYDKGYYINEISMGEHIGTHVDAPAHFAQGTKTIDQIPPKQLIGNAVVVNVVEKVRENPDYLLTVQDIHDWEKEHGRIPDNAIVLMYTGWGERWEEPKRYINQDKEGEIHFPAFSKEAAEFLIQNRWINGIGIDTFSLDSGISKDFPVHHVMLVAGKFQIENIANLDRLPPVGAIVIVNPIKIKDGSGAPARILALLPGQKN